MPPAFSDARTLLFRFFPGFFRTQIFEPERIRAALRGTCRIHGATLVFIENAPSIGMFLQASTLSHPAGMAKEEGSTADAQVLREAVDFLVVHPDMTRLAGTTMPAPGALESNAVVKEIALIHSHGNKLAQNHPAGPAQQNRQVAALNPASASSNALFPGFASETPTSGHCFVGAPLAAPVPGDFRDEGVPPDADRLRLQTQG